MPKNGSLALSLTMPDVMTAYDNLIGVESTQASGVNLVEPGDSANSYLWRKIDGSQAKVGGSGMRMGGGLSSDEIDRIAQWIDQGAEP